MRKLGWKPDLPDHRDYVIDEHPTTVHLFTPPRSLTGIAPGKGGLPARLDLSQFCSPVEDQGALGSCTAQAVVGVVEYLERRAMKRHVDASRLFVYKTGRMIDGYVGDTGLSVRTGMKALATFGAPPERYWPYDIDRFDDDPGAFVYAYGQRFRALRYYRLDIERRSRMQLLLLMKKVMVYGLPIAFGFIVYSWGDDRGAFPMPEEGQEPQGGHAVVAVGYDDDIRIGDSTGALRIRNSWGTGWGQSGYGWLPYDYVLQTLSADFWTIFSQDYQRD